MGGNDTSGVDTNPAASTLVAIGGHEEKEGDRAILRRVAELLPKPRVVVATLASSAADEMWSDYKRAFSDLNVEPVHLSIDERLEAARDDQFDLLEAAGGIFFTGGDQAALTSKMGGTPLCDRIHELFRKGFVIAGTSAGASVLSETMIVSGDANESHRAGSALQMAPGLGFLPGVVIDQHFAQRGRIGRLLGVVAQNPRTLGLGVDENTAVVIRDDCFEIIGNGAVYVLDGRPITHSNIAEAEPDISLSVFNVTLHVLSAGDKFHMRERRPLPGAK